MLAKDCGDGEKFAINMEVAYSCVSEFSCFFFFLEVVDTQAKYCRC